MGCQYSICQQSTAAAAPTSSPPPSEPVVEPVVPTSPPGSAPKSDPTSTGVSAPTSLKPAFVINGYSIFETGVVYYTVERADESTAAMQKRFREFKALHQALSQAHPKETASLPDLPDSGVRAMLQGRHSPQLLKAREEQLAALLNGIAANPTLSATDEFNHFLSAVRA